MAARPVGARGKIKGSAFAEFLNWYEKRFGRDPVIGALAGAEQSFSFEIDRTRHGFGILASHWYDAEIVHCVLDQLAARHSKSELDALALDAADAIMTKTLRGVYRAVFALAVNPARYAQHVEKLWRLHYDTGVPLILAPDAHQHRVSYKDWKSHHPIICRLNMASARPIYSAMGCSNVRYERIACVSEGATHCESTITWS
jgi:hypothetical protein